MSERAKKSINDWYDTHESMAKEFLRAVNRIAELEAALRGLDDLIVDLEMGRMELYQVSDFINAKLAGGKDE